MQRPIARAASAAILILCAPALAQFQFAEVGDAGPTLATAASPLGLGPLTRITGTISLGGDADIFRIRITDPAAFSASAIASLGTQAPPLYLFDAAGRGVAQARGRSFDEGGLGPVPTAFTSAFVTAPGDYFLAVTTQQSTALDTMSRLIWAATPGILSQIAPTGPGAAGTFSLFNLPFTAGGGYTIDLTGAAAVPAPSAAGLITAGLAFAVRRRRR